MDFLWKKLWPSSKIYKQEENFKSSFVVFFLSQQKLNQFFNNKMALEICYTLFFKFFACYFATLNFIWFFLGNLFNNNPRNTFWQIFKNYIFLLLKVFIILIQYFFFPSLNISKRNNKLFFCSSHSFFQLDDTKFLNIFYVHLKTLTLFLFSPNRTLIFII